MFVWAFVLGLNSQCLASQRMGRKTLIGVIVMLCHSFLTKEFRENPLLFPLKAAAG